MSNEGENGFSLWRNGALLAHGYVGVNDASSLAASSIGDYLRNARIVKRQSIAMACAGMASAARNSGIASSTARINIAVAA